MRIKKARATVRYVPIYHCHKCGAESPGDTERLELECTEFADISKRLAGLTLRASAIPVGWASYYSLRATVFRCAQCVTP